LVELFDNCIGWEGIRWWRFWSGFGSREGIRFRLLGGFIIAWVMIEKAGFVLFESLSFGSVDGVFLLKLRTDTLRIS
jgi:hypothetical protein